MCHFGSISPLNCPLRFFVPVQPTARKSSLERNPVPVSAHQGTSCFCKILRLPSTLFELDLDMPGWLRHSTQRSAGAPFRARHAQKRTTPRSRRPKEFVHWRHLGSAPCPTGGHWPNPKCFGMDYNKRATLNDFRATDPVLGVLLESLWGGSMKHADVNSEKSRPVPPTDPAPTSQVWMCSFVGWYDVSFPG